MAASFVPDDFDPPVAFEGSGFRLEPLGAEHNERDHEAWMSSVDHIRATPGLDDFGGWPEPMSLDQNREDLERHAADFIERTGFTYSVLDGDAVIGCLYIYPTSDPGHDASVVSWVRESRAEMDVVLWHEVSAWLADVWPFTSPRYASR